jgi:hypothetical protein
MNSASQFHADRLQGSTDAAAKWTNTTQQLRNLLNSSGTAVLKHLDSLTSLCSTFESLPAVSSFPVQLQHKQQQACDQLLVLLPQLLVKLLGQRPKQWQQDEQLCSSIRSVLQCLHHLCVSAGINHTVDASSMPLLSTLAQNWQACPLLGTITSALQDMAQLLTEQRMQPHQPVEGNPTHPSTPSHSQMALAYALVYV